MTFPKQLYAFALCVVSLRAQPHINYRGIVNAASFTPVGASGSAIAQGSIFSIFGDSLGPASLVQVSTFPLSSTLAGVSIKVTQGNVSVDALPLVVTAGQVNAIMPSNAPLGRVSIQLAYLAMHPDGTRVYVAPEGGGPILVLNTATHTIVNRITIPLGTAPPPATSPVFSPTGRYLFVVDGPGTLSMIDTVSDTLFNSLPLDPALVNAPSHSVKVGVVVLPAS